MSETTFDTIRAAKFLQEAGINTAQAEAIALLVKDAQGELATKSDIKQLEEQISNFRFTVFMLVVVAVVLTALGVIWKMPSRRFLLMLVIASAL